jgi:hypothetical protein
MTLKTPACWDRIFWGTGQSSLKPIKPGLSRENRYGWDPYNIYYASQKIPVFFMDRVLREPPLVPELSQIFHSIRRLQIADAATNKPCAPASETVDT